MYLLWDESLLAGTMIVLGNYGIERLIDRSNIIITAYRMENSRMKVKVVILL